MTFPYAATAQEESHRIVSLAPNVTELLFDIGAENKLVATVEYSDYPEAAKAVPRVGDVYQLDWEQLLRLKPDMVIGWQDGTPEHVLQRVKSLGLPLVVVRAGKLDSVASQLRQLGILTGKVNQSELVANDFIRKLKILENEYRGRRSVKVFYEIDHRPLYTISDKQIISDAISLCGGVNIFSGYDVLAPQVSIESVLQREPEVIIYSGSEQEAENAFADWGRWSQLLAVRNSHLYRINPDLMNRPTPRMLQGIKQLCEVIDDAR